MNKKLATLLVVISFVNGISAQQMVLKKGTILESLVVNDTLPDTFSLYLPTSFSINKQWPLLMVFDLKGREKKAMSMFVQAAEDEGYILAAPQVREDQSLSINIQKTSQSIKRIVEMLPIQKSRIYVAGAGAGGRFANLTPIFMKEVHGVISIDANITNFELLDVKRPFHFIGILNKKSYNYPDLLDSKRILDRFKFPNQLLIHEEDRLWPDTKLLKKSLRFFTLGAMRKGYVSKDTSFIEQTYAADLVKANQLKGSMKLLRAEQYMGEMMGVYGAYKNLDSLRLVQREVRRNKMFKSMKRTENAAFLKETLLKEDFQYYMEEDLVTHNFNNLGWWNFQYGEINKFIEGANVFERDMGYRLLGYVNALAEDNIDVVESEALVDEDALAFLYMLKTILEPSNFDFYLRIISLSSKNEDFGTALFYLEEALKNGFKDKDALYTLENTALLRIDPRFNKLVLQYLKDARYNIKEQ
nr:alpha/beta hydrolase [Allomuricauda sp.]